MRKIRLTEHQIIAAGRTVKDVYREAAISEANYYNWKAKYGGIILEKAARYSAREPD